MNEQEGWDDFNKFNHTFISWKQTLFLVVVFVSVISFSSYYSGLMDGIVGTIITGIIVIGLTTTTFYLKLTSPMNANQLHNFYIVSIGFVELILITMLVFAIYMHFPLKL